LYHVLLSTVRVEGENTGQYVLVQASQGKPFTTFFGFAVYLKAEHP